MAKYDDLNVRGIAVAGIASVVIVIVCIVGIQAVYFDYKQREDQKKVVDAQPVFADSVLAEQRSRLNEYGWIDKEKQIVAIPIDRAMEIVVKEEAAKRTKVDTADVR
ncbi:MAG: hypothetical protein C0478_10270 [Planctomyces sp.]|jgi:hypothetical protein|nr:hypothetical protein [Planctomyces sp.]